MTDNVIRLVVDSVGDGAEISPASILKNIDGDGLVSIAIVAIRKDDGEVIVCGSHGMAESFLLLARGKDFLMSQVHGG